ncbi:MAG: hypothetical protein OES32_02795 [Acidobacteriota bacterium]|nr:hypothetical protein [Acidobacteriota bacterium]MDH3522490.1 hypothetical protein [Acidobacteriota bacterium]
MKVAEMQRETFAPHVKQTFRVSADEVAFDTELIEVSALGETVGPEGRRAFSLVFRGPLDPFIEQRICRIEHEELGVIDLFLVPVGPDEKGMRYEAVFT